MFPNGPFGNSFPYTNFHSMNLDWVIQVAKDFLDQYTHLQETITQGEQDIQDLADRLQGLLNDWYDTHSQDIADQLASALSDLNAWYTEHSEDIANELSTALSTALTSFQQGASEIAAEVVESIPEDYTELSANVTNLMATMGERVLTPEFSPGFINPSTLQESSGGYHVVSSPILIKAGTLLTVPRVNKSINTCLVAECESDGTPTACLVRGTSTSDSDGSFITIPFLQDTYVRLGGNTSMSAYMKYSIKEYTEDFIFDQNNIHDWMNNTLESLYAVGAITDSGVDTDATWFTYTASLRLMKGMCLEFWATAGSNINILSGYDYVSYSFEESIFHGNSTIQHVVYTAPKNMFVRICSRNYPSPAGYAVVMPESKFFSWKIYNPNTHFKNIENHPLYGKHLAVMGDSLIKGNVLGEGATWPNTIGIKYNMSYTNMGINGNTVAQQTEETLSPAMVNRISDVPTNTEYFVLLGGANDKRLNIPIGPIDSADETTFCGAINKIIDQLHTRIPRAHLLFMTTYDRYATLNAQGYGDKDYADAMIAVCKNRKVPVFDNYRCSGVSFTVATLDNWLDECNNRQWNNDGTIEYYDPTHHFSVEGYDWLIDMYTELLISSTATGYDPDTEIDPWYIETVLNASGAENLTGSNSYVTTEGKYINIGSMVYFKAIFHNTRDVNTSTGANVITNLPEPDTDALLFNESTGILYNTGSKLRYEDNAWSLRGSRTTGDVGVVYGMYKGT